MFKGNYRGIHCGSDPSTTMRNKIPKNANPPQKTKCDGNAAKLVGISEIKRPFFCWSIYSWLLFRRPSPGYDVGR